MPLSSSLLSSENSSELNAPNSEHQLRSKTFFYPPYFLFSGIYFHPERKNNSAAWQFILTTVILEVEQHITQPETSWRQVTNEKQPFKNSSLLHIRQMLDSDSVVTESMNAADFSAFLIYSGVGSGHQKWICVPLGFVNLVPGMLEQVLHQSAK